MSGWKSIARESSSGSSSLPCTCWTMSTTRTHHSAVVRPPDVNATAVATAPARIGPIVGMKPAKNVTMPIGTANGTPRIHMPMPMRTPETMPVTTAAPSHARAVRASERTVAVALCRQRTGNIRTPAFARSSPPRSANSITNSTTIVTVTSVLTASTPAAATLPAPETMLPSQEVSCSSMPAGMPGPKPLNHSIRSWTPATAASESSGS